MNVYADNAATTRMSQAAVDAMLPFLRESYGNPSSLYTLGQKAAESLQASRETMAKYLGCDAREIKFETFGCGSAIASSSMATELIKGKPLSQALELTNKAVAEALDGLPAYKMHCSVLAEEAIKAAVKDYYDKHGIAYDESKFPDCSHCDHCEA